MRIPLARYGIREVLLFGGPAVIGTVLSLVYAWPLTPVFVLALAFVLWFFRDPVRRAPTTPGAVISPADGRVVEVAEVDEPRFLKTRARKVAIFMSPMDVHVNRFPCDGRVEAVEHRPGRFLNAANPAASAENESNSMVIAGEGGLRLLVRQVSGVLARRIVCRAAVGDTARRGEPFGMIKIGSRAEVYVPLETAFEVSVSLGQHVKAGETILGCLR